MAFTKLALALSSLAFSAPALAQCPRDVLRSPEGLHNDLFGYWPTIAGDWAMATSRPYPKLDFHVFDLANGTDYLIQAPGTHFGPFSAIHGDTAVIGGRGECFVYDLPTGTLLHTLESPTPSIWFGRSIEIDAQHVYVAGYSPADVAVVFVFDRASGTIISQLAPSTPAPTNRFGQSISSHGGRLLIGDPDGNDGGQAFLFDIATGAELALFQSPPELSEQDYGALVSLEGDLALVAARWDGWSRGRAHLYDIAAGLKIKQFTSPGFYESAVVSGGVVVLGDTSSSETVRIYDTVSGSSTHVFSPYEEEVRFGYHVAFDGTRLLVSAPLVDGQASNEGSGFVYELCARVGQSYCGPAVENSTGKSARLRASGSASVAAGDLHLAARNLPLDQASLFLVADSQGLVVPPGSEGNLCLAGSLGRYGEVGSGLDGAVVLSVDLDELPIGDGLAVHPGETWNFQVWYRDANPGDTSNFTQAVSVQFQ